MLQGRDRKTVECLDRKLEAKKTNVDEGNFNEACVFPITFKLRNQLDDKIDNIAF